MINRKSYNEQVASYYDRSAWMYKYLWYGKKSLGLHYGLWNKKTKTHDQSLTNHYDYVIDALHISKKMCILDAGCGVGGACQYIAAKTKAYVTGISITKSQIEEADKLRITSPYRKKLTFLSVDYTDTKFPSQSYDGIYGIESICHAYPKKAFLKEAYRLLKLKGTLVIIDGYCARKPLSAKERELIYLFCKGFRLREMIEIDSMKKEIEKTGFKIKLVDDLSPLVHKSLERMRWIARMLGPITFLSRIVPVPLFLIAKENVQAVKASIEGIYAGLFGYYAIVAEK